LRQLFKAYAQLSRHCKVRPHAITVRSSTPDFAGNPYSRAHMDRILLFWDEIDDWAGAGRHLAAAVASELVVLAGPLLSAGSAVAAWFMLPQFHMNAALLGLTATFWGSYRTRLHPHG
jgi:hypothetical protein